MKRPAGLAHQRRRRAPLALQKTSSITTAVDCDFHLVGLRKASEAEIAAGQAAGALSAAVSTLTTTITGVSDALAALQTSLATTAPGGVTALLSSTYLTAVGTTSAIAAAEASLQTNINGVSTNLATNYYTRSQVDGGISTAVGGLSTELGGRIEDTEIAISDETGFRVAGDNALGGRISTLEARSDPGSVVTNGSFATGELTGWAGGIAGQAVHANFTVVAKGGTVSAQQQCPTAFMLKIAVDAGTTRTIFNELCEAKAGDTISLSALYAAGGTTRDITLRFIVRWRDVNGTVVGSPFTEVAQLHRHRLDPGADAQLRRAGEHRQGRHRDPAHRRRLRRRLCDRHRGPQGRHGGAGADRRDRDRGDERLERDRLAQHRDQRHLRQPGGLPQRDVDGGRLARPARLDLRAAPARRRGRRPRRGGRLLHPGRHRALHLPARLRLHRPRRPGVGARPGDLELGEPGSRRPAAGRVDLGAERRRMVALPEHQHRQRPLARRGALHRHRLPPAAPSRPARTSR